MPNNFASLARSFVQTQPQQCPEFGQRFATAAAMMRDNRVGDVRKLTVAIGGSRVLPIPAHRRSTQISELGKVAWSMPRRTISAGRIRSRVRLGGGLPNQPRTSLLPLVV